MFKPSKATSIDGYIAALAPERRKIIEHLHRFIQKNARRLKPHFASNMLGYGSYTYRNYKKQEIEWPVVALASQKSYVSVYVCVAVDGVYLAEKYRDQLGKASIGKSCIRFKRLEDINLDTLAKIIKEAAAVNAGDKAQPSPKKAPQKRQRKAGAGKRHRRSGGMVSERGSVKALREALALGLAVGGVLVGADLFAHWHEWSDGVRGIYVVLTASMICGCSALFLPTGDDEDA